MRADQLLLERQLAGSRSQAQRLIAAGVQWRLPGAAWQPVRKNGEELPVQAELQLQDAAETRYVSRGGLKLEGALQAIGLDVTGLRCLDVGQSTGGFTDCLLQAGAARVVGIDVGHDQLHPRLRADDRVRWFEGVNARAPELDSLRQANDGALFDLIVGDVSFISLTLTLPPLLALLRPGGHILHLVKPQFEVGREGIGRGGLVKDPSRYLDVRMRMESMAVENHLNWLNWLDSPITGGDGNREFFMHAYKPL